MRRLRQRVPPLSANKDEEAMRKFAKGKSLYVLPECYETPDLMKKCLGWKCPLICKAYTNKKEALAATKHPERLITMEVAGDD